MSRTLVPAAPALGISPWVAGFVVLVASNVWVLPYQGLEYLIARDATATDRLRDMVRVYVMSVTANLDAVGIYLREWRSLPAPELAREWIESGTEVRVRVENVDRSIEQLERIKNAMGPGLADVPASNRIWSGATDHERNRIVFTTDRVNDAMLWALAARFGTEALAVRIERNPFFRNIAARREPR